MLVLAQAASDDLLDSVIGCVGETGLFGQLRGVGVRDLPREGAIKSDLLSENYASRC